VSVISVAALVPYAPGTTPSQRFRIEQWIPLLQEHGIQVRVLPFADPLMTDLMQRPGHFFRKARLALPAAARQAHRVVFGRLGDVVLVHRAAALFGPPLLEWLLALRGRPLVFDFDDAIFLPHETETNRRLAWLKSPRKTGTICRLSSHVVVGNAYLADYARRFNPRVSVVPSSIDTDRYRPRTAVRGDGKVVVGWMGSSTSQTYLEMFAEMLREVAAIPGVEIRVISNRRPDLPGIPVVWQPWSAKTEVEDIAAFDVGIMPMPDTEWARGKCALKALQYMAMGVATVASAVGANREVIEHGRDGLLASTDAEWVASLRMLTESAELRACLGRAGRETVETRYSMRSSAAAFAEVVRSVVERTRP
jgi:glycosyltransferase involved in cell wall biosynthesis